MDKEHIRREKLKAMDERTRKEEETKFNEAQKQHKEHPALHHPVCYGTDHLCDTRLVACADCFHIAFLHQGSKAQLEEVWEETDGLPKEEFDPKTFFKLHGIYFIVDIVSSLTVVRFRS